MKNNTEKADFIFYLWKKENLSIKEITKRKIPFFLSLKRIRNIVYGGEKRATREREKEIIRTFVAKFLEIQDVHQAIMHVYENQPECFVSEKTIRRILVEKMKEKKIIPDYSGLHGY